MAKLTTAEEIMNYLRTTPENDFMWSGEEVDDILNAMNTAMFEECLTKIGFRDLPPAESLVIPRFTQVIRDKIKKNSGTPPKFYWPKISERIRTLRNDNKWYLPTDKSIDNLSKGKPMLSLEKDIELSINSLSRDSFIEYFANDGFDCTLGHIIHNIEYKDFDFSVKTRLCRGIAKKMQKFRNSLDEDDFLNLTNCLQNVARTNRPLVSKFHLPSFNLPTFGAKTKSTKTPKLKKSPVNSGTNEYEKFQSKIASLRLEDIFVIKASPDGDTIYITDSFDDLLNQIELSSLSIKRKFSLLDSIYDRYNEIKNNNREEDDIIQDFLSGSKKNIKLNLQFKALCTTVGFVSGLGLSCVPGVGKVRMVLSGAKLANNTIMVWSNEHPDGKVAKVYNAAKSIVPEKIRIGLSRIDKKLKTYPANAFLNGVAAGYMVGNAIELITGKTILGHINSVGAPAEATLSPDTGNTQLQDNSGQMSSQPSTSVDTGSTTSISPSNGSENVSGSVGTGGTNIVEQVASSVKDIDLNSTFFDLSNVKGLVSSDSENLLSIMKSVACKVKFDRAVLVNGEIRVHFVDTNGVGVAWYRISDIVDKIPDDALEQISELAEKIKVR